MNQPDDPGTRGECCLKREKDLVKAVFILYTLNVYVWSDALGCIYADNSSAFILRIGKEVVQVWNAK